MILNDKRFWIFEAIVLICSIIAMVILWADQWFILPHILVPTAFCCLFLIGHSVETIQRQSMVEVGRIHTSIHNGTSCHCAVRSCMGLA